MRILLTALFVSALAACTTPATTAPEPSAHVNHLSGTKWRRVDDMNANPHGATIEFEGARASGYTGCNRWFADVSEDGGSLRFGPIGMTRMACQTEMQRDTERNFVSMLERVRYVDYDQSALAFQDEQQNVIAEFQVE